MNWAIMTTTAPPRYCSPIRGRIHFTHFSHGILARDKAAIKYPEVGVSILEIASPSWKATTVVYLVTPIKSPRGAKIGIETAAWPEPDGIRKFKRHWNR